MDPKEVSHAGGGGGGGGGGGSEAGAKRPEPASPGAEGSKILGRNCNGTVVLTSSPKNEAELQLYRVMQRASLLAYYDTLLEMGGDDVQQLCDAGEEEFLEIMALVGMASKPLHVRRLQKALQEWVTNPALFQTPLASGLPTSPVSLSHPAASLRPSNALPGVTPPVLPLALPGSRGSPAPKEASPSASPDQNQVAEVPGQKDHPVRLPSPSPAAGPQGPGSPLQATPVLVESQISKLAETAEALVKTLPQFEPKPHNTKKKICRDLENVMNMAEDDPRRMDEIRKYAAIYGRFDCKRNPQKPLTLHEVSVNEAAAQICRFSPALLTRRDDLFSLARQVVRDSGYHYTKGQCGIASAYRMHSFQSGNKAADENQGTKRPKKNSCCDNGDSDRLKRQERLDQIADELRVLGEKTEELVQAAHQVRQTNDLSSIQSLQLQMEAVQSKQTQLLLEQSDLLKQPLPSRFYRRNNGRTCSSHFESDDTDSQPSLSNASSPSQEVGDSRDSLLRDGESNSNSNGVPPAKSPSKPCKQYATDISGDGGQGGFFFQDSKVQVISASGGNIIAVANPALSMSSIVLQPSEGGPGETDGPLSLKVENHKPD